MITLLVMIGPILAGLMGTVLPALGYMPALGRNELSWAPFASLSEWPGLYWASFLSVFVGFLATATSLTVVILICASLDQTRSFRIVERALSPLLSLPHAAAAFGLAFLIAPSGWISRLLSPWFTGWQTPPDILILQDPLGLSLAAGLISKEVPFLLLMTLAAYPQIRRAQSLNLATTLGYSPVVGWSKVVLPQVYKQIRLPVFAVLAYSMTVIDVAIILGPNTPPSLSVQVLRWMNDPDLDMRFTASAGALLQLALVFIALFVWTIGEKAIAKLGRIWIFSGHRGKRALAFRIVAMCAAGILVGSVGLGLIGQFVWSFSGFWAYPDAFPPALTTRTWMGQLPNLLPTVSNTILIAVVASLASITMVLACLESEFRFGIRPGTNALWLLYLPLITPQISFLGGLQTLAIFAGVDGNLAAVTFVHVIFVLPYVFLSLSGPFRSWDYRYATVASTLGASSDRIFWNIRMPMMLRSGLTAFAVGCAVSISQYLPTLLAGAGRVQTLTTEAVALSSGGNRRIIAVYAISQTLAALLPFILALGLPALVHRNRKGLRFG